MIFVNQLCFVYAVDKTSAATVTLFLGTTPIFIGVVAGVVGLERMGRGFWIAAAVSLVGVAFVASGSGGFSGRVVRRRARASSTALDLGGVLGLDHAADAPLLAVPDQRARARARLVPLALAGFASDDAARTSTSATLVWVGFAFAVIGPLFLTNILWFTAIIAGRAVARVALLEPAAGLRRPCSRSCSSGST